MENNNTPTVWVKDYHHRAILMAEEAKRRRAGKKMVQIKPGTWVYLAEGEKPMTMPTRFIDTIKAEISQSKTEKAKREYAYQGKTYNLTDLAKELGRDPANLHTSLKAPMYRLKYGIQIIVK